MVILTKWFLQCVVTVASWVWIGTQLLGGNSLLASASWVDSACCLAAWTLATLSLRLLPGLTQLAVQLRGPQLLFPCLCFLGRLSLPFYTDRGTIIYENSLCMPGLQIMDTHQVREYQDSTVLTVLIWQMITTLNRKLLGKQRVQNCFASYEVSTGHFFTMSMHTVSILSRLEIV